MNNPIETDLEQAAPVWRAPRLVPLSAAGSSDNGLAKNATEGQIITVPAGQYKGTFALGSG